MENQVPRRTSGRSFHPGIRILAFLVFVIGFLGLHAALMRFGQSQTGPSILVGALLGASVAVLFGLAEWLTLRSPR